MWHTLYISTNTGYYYYLLLIIIIIIVVTFSAVSIMVSFSTNYRVNKWKCVIVDFGPDTWRGKLGADEFTANAILDLFRTEPLENLEDNEALYPKLQVCSCVQCLQIVAVVSKILQQYL